MSQTDRDRLVALKKAKDRKITQRQAAEELTLSERQVRRLLAKLKAQGDRAVIHGLRGRPSNRRIGEERRQEAIGILRQDKYQGFGPTLASEYLAKKHRIIVRERRCGSGCGRRACGGRDGKRWRRSTQWRPRRERFGELVQWDTSEHDWLEGRGEKIYLIKMIDDATSRLFARFVRQDSTVENMAVLEQYLRRYGRPLEFYTDKASLFVTTPKKNHTQRDEELPPTQIGRALKELGVGSIAAHSPKRRGGWSAASRRRRTAW